MSEEIFLDTTFLLPFFGIDLDYINSFVKDLYINSKKIIFADISIYETLFKIISLQRKKKGDISLIADFWKKLKILLDDEKIVFKKLDEEIVSYINSMEEEIKLDIIDEIIVATSIPIGKLITLDKKILNAKELLSKKYNLKVFTPRDFTKNYADKAPNF